MAVYNARQYLQPCIESVLRQSYPDFEFVIVDDGSTDGSDHIVEQFARQDPRIRLYKQPNRGVSAARNLAVSHSRFQLLATMDADDIMLPSRLQRQLEFMQQHPDASVGCSYAQLIDRNGKVIGSSHTIVDVRRGREQRNPHLFLEIVHPSTIIRKQALLDVGGYSDQFRVAVDRELWGRFVTAGHLIEVMPESLIQYRLHQSSVTAKDMFDHHFTCEFIDFNIVRRLNGEEQLTLSEFRALLKSKPAVARFGNLLASVSRVYYKKATRHFAEHHWLPSLGCLALAVSISPYRTTRRVLDRIQ
jgi:glycosyltransferase involved in cell wall biosynthesis